MEVGTSHIYTFGCYCTSSFSCQVHCTSIIWNNMSCTTTHVCISPHGAQTQQTRIVIACSQQTHTKRRMSTGNSIIVESEMQNKNRNRGAVGGTKSEYTGETPQDDEDEMTSIDQLNKHSMKIKNRFRT